MLLFAQHFRYRAVSAIAWLSLSLALTAPLAHAQSEPSKKPKLTKTPPAARAPSTPDGAEHAADGGIEGAAAGAEQAPPSCPSSANLVRNAVLTADGVTGSQLRVRDGVLAFEGTTWSAPDAVVLKEPNANLRVDLGAPHELRGLVLQGDNNDLYVIEGSLDGETWTPLWTAPATDVGQGLRTRSVVLPKPVLARHLRVTGKGGDNFYSVSELQAYCQLPSVFPPPLRLPPRKYGWDAINNESMVVIKGIVAAAAALILLASFLRRFSEARISSRRWRAGIFGAVTLTALGCGYLGYAITAESTPEGLRKFAKIAGSTAGWYWSAGILGAFALLFLLLFLRREGPRLIDTGIALVGLFSFFGWWNLGHFHFDHYIHIWEHYHYVVGAKYVPELRYSRLYECTAVADVQDGRRAQVKARKMRTLGEDNSLGTTERILREPERCTSHFTSAERWEQFRKDIRFFRGRFSRERWDQSQHDHGYNATPVWSIAGRLIADRTELTWNNIVKLGIIDSAYLVVAWIGVLWAFGWRAACVALVYWGTNFPARFYWNGGSFLRYDWMLWMVLGLCFLRKERMFLGGAALTYATLLRVFPGFIVATLVLKALAAMVRERRIFLSRPHVFFAAGCITALAVLVPASSWATGGLDAWGEFAQNSKKHLSTALTNNMGLKTVMGYDFDTRAVRMRNDKLDDPFKEWKDAKQHFYAERAPLFYAVVLLFCLMLARAADREREDWAAACLGTGLIAIAPEITCYYYGFLLGYGLLWERRKLPGIAAALLAAFTCLAYKLIPWNDDHFAAMSLGTTIVVVGVTAHVAFGKRKPTIDEAEPELPSLPSTVPAPPPVPAPPALADRA